MYIKIFILILLIAIIGFLLYSLYFYKETFKNNTSSKKSVPFDVIIPCIPRDTPKLERVLKSIENQTKLPYKVIIAHSELNDDEASKIEKQHEKLPFKVVVNNTTEKKYAGENRNRGFSSSNQEFISFFDADDEMKPNRLEEIMKVFNNTDSKCVMHLFKKNNLPNEYYNDKDIIQYISKNNSNNIDKNTNFSKLRKNGYEGIFPSLHHGTPSIKKEVFEKVKQSNNPRGQDQDFLFDVFEHFKNSGNVFTIINKPLQTYVPAEKQKIEHFSIPYRLGDMIKGWGRDDEKNGIKAHFKYYPNSIVSKYLKKTNDNNNIEVLNEVCDIIKKRNNVKIPFPNELVIHLRLGDVIENSKYSSTQHWENYLNSEGPGLPGYKYIKPKSFFINVIKKIKNKHKNIDKIILIWGDHKNLKSLKKSNEYIKRINDLFNRHHYDVNVFFNRDADEDFIYMSNAKYFVPTGGGFSKLISKMVQFNNNNVLYESTDKFID